MNLKEVAIQEVSFHMVGKSALLVKNNKDLKFRGAPFWKLMPGDMKIIQLLVFTDQRVVKTHGNFE